MDTTTLPKPIPEAHVLVVGAGGIGCPAAWALKHAGLGKMTLIDPDVVELSNLPRQILFAEENLGESKAAAGAARLDRADTPVRAVRARLDDTNAVALLDGVDVILDATDGATTKDWLNQLAVRRGVPLVHAAALRSEARLLVVPAGGRPCLACIFGRLTEETGSCADLGVWNAVVGTVGFLAADAVLKLIEDPAAAPAGYAVLDFESGRALTLAAAPNPACPVCASAGTVEAYPADVGCAVPPEAVAVRDRLDLSAERCPMNLLRARQALAALPAGAVLEILLGEEGAATVPDGVRALGHEVLETETLSLGLRLQVRASGLADRSRMDDESLRRYARQIVLPEFGERGQGRLQQSQVVIAGKGIAVDVAKIYLQAAGVAGVFVYRFETPAPALPEGALVAWVGGRRVSETLRARAPDAVVLAKDGDACHAQVGWDHAREADDAPDVLQRAWGTLLADAVQRRIVLDDAPARSLGLPLP